MRPIGHLHILTDSELQSRWSPLDLARAAIEGGADTIQYRRKHGSTRAMLEEIIAIRELCRRKKVPLIVNDRVDLALCADADGVHLGGEDLPIPLARDILGPARIIGGSVETEDGAPGRWREGADYAGIGPIFATPSKLDAAPAIGLEALGRAVRIAGLPLIAIGGINEATLADVLATGVHGVALLGAVCHADDPAAVVARMRALIEARRA
jgi:thiamine-phosphate pyrophosphorylase